MCVDTYKYIQKTHREHLVAFGMSPMIGNLITYFHVQSQVVYINVCKILHFLDHRHHLKKQFKKELIYKIPFFEWNPLL